MDKKTPLGLTLFARRCRDEGVLYWYACQYQIRTKALLDRKAAGHAWYQMTYNGVVNYDWCLTTVSDTGRACDCVGLPLAYAWWALDDDPITFHYQANNCPDYSANQEYNSAKVKGDISTIPEVLGLGLWQEGHCGIYLGGGWTIESSSGTDYLTGNKVRGVFMGRLGKGTKWQAWFQYPWLSYPNDNSWIVKNAPLTEAEMQNNAFVFASYMMGHGWTLESVCGMLGNLQSESRINPGAWQGYVQPFPTPADKVGFGLTQWTPYTKYTDWAGTNYASGNKQCDRIIYERDNKIQFYPTTNYPMTFAEFSQSTRDPGYLAQVFLYNYERPALPDPRTRAAQARTWYDYLNKYPSPLQPPTKKLPYWLIAYMGGVRHGSYRI